MRRREGGWVRRALDLACCSHYGVGDKCGPHIVRGIMILSTLDVMDWMREIYLCYVPHTKTTYASEAVLVQQKFQQRKRYRQPKITSKNGLRFKDFTATEKKGATLSTFAHFSYSVSVHPTNVYLITTGVSL